MEANKENMKRIKTKIPVPVQPLPALSKHLLQRSAILRKEKNERYPLKTLTSEENLMLPGPSRKSKSEEEIKIDSRHVTLRKKDLDEKDLDWEFKVFRDEFSKGILSDEDEKENKAGLLADKRINIVDEYKVATPASRALEPNRVKNIKRSLKRPHSRELQGLSPVVNEQKRCDDKSKRRLQFNEPIKERLQSLDHLKKSYASSLCQDYAADMFSHLLSTEKQPLSSGILLSNTMRACVINWLLKVNGADGNPATVQTAVWYLDSILSLSEVLVDKLQLLGAACYWIAHKLHGPGLAASHLVKFANNKFSIREVQKAEKEILIKLKFPPQPVVPQEYISYLSWWCKKSHLGEVEVAATFLCMSGLMVDKNLCTETPSVVGAAAVRSALLLLSKKGLIQHLVSCPVYQSAARKTANMAAVCSSLRWAVRRVACSSYEFKAPFEHYGIPPYYIAHRIVNAAQRIDAELMYND